MTAIAIDERRTRVEALRGVTRKAAALARTGEQFEHEIRHAHNVGCSLREIAAAAGVAHETVRRTLGETKRVP